VKRGLLCLMVVALFIGGKSLFAAAAPEPGDTVIQFFEASKNGDTKTITQLISRELDVHHAYISSPDQSPAI